MSSKKTGAVLQGMSRGMAIDIQNSTLMSDVLECVDTMVGVLCSDKASSNVSAMCSMRSSTVHHPPKWMLDERFCELHNLNNLKFMSDEYKRLVGRFFGLANLMRCSDYVCKAIKRIETFVEAKLQFLPDQRPDPACAARNRALADAIFDLSAEHHARRNKKGYIIDKSSLTTDLGRLLQLEAGDFHSDRIEHCCAIDPSTNKLCCQDKAECVFKVSEAYVRRYFGRHGLYRRPAALRTSRSTATSSPSRTFTTRCCCR